MIFEHDAIKPENFSDHLQLTQRAMTRIVSHSQIVDKTSYCVHDCGMNYPTYMFFLLQVNPERPQYAGPWKF